MAYKLIPVSEGEEIVFNYHQQLAELFTIYQTELKKNRTILRSKIASRIIKRKSYLKQKIKKELNEKCTLILSKKIKEFELLLNQFQINAELDLINKLRKLYNHELREFSAKAEIIKNELLPIIKELYSSDIIKIQTSRSYYSSIANLINQYYPELNSKIKIVENHPGFSISLHNSSVNFDLNSYLETLI